MCLNFSDREKQKFVHVSRETKLEVERHELVAHFTLHDGKP